MNDDFDLAMLILLVTMCGIALTLTKIAIQIERINSSSLVEFPQGYSSTIAYEDRNVPQLDFPCCGQVKLPNFPPMYSIIRETHHALIYWD